MFMFYVSLDPPLKSVYILDSKECVTLTLNDCHKILQK